MRPFTDDKVCTYTRCIASTLVKILFGKAAEAAVFNDTLVVIVGDHGESFGEEEATFMVQCHEPNTCANDVDTACCIFHKILTKWKEQGIKNIGSRPALLSKRHTKSLVDARFIRGR